MFCFVFHFTSKIPTILVWPSATTTGATCIHGIDYNLPGISLYWQYLASSIVLSWYHHQPGKNMSSWNSIVKILHPELKAPLCNIWTNLSWFPLSRAQTLSILISWLSTSYFQYSQYSGWEENNNYIKIRFTLTLICWNISSVFICAYKGFLSFRWMYFRIPHDEGVIALHPWKIETRSCCWKL